MYVCRRGIRDQGISDKGQGTGDKYAQGRSLAALVPGRAAGRAAPPAQLRYDNPVRPGARGETESDGFFPVCGKPTNFFPASRNFDGFPAARRPEEVENPVENVDNRAVFPPGAAVILGNYVYRLLPLVALGKECRTVTSPWKCRREKNFCEGFSSFALEISKLLCYDKYPLSPISASPFHDALSERGRVWRTLCAATDGSPDP